MKVDGICWSISMTSDERTVAIGISDGRIRTTLLADTDTLKVNHKINGEDPKFAKEDKLIFAATNNSKDITIYQVPSSLIVRLDSD